jgi:predicted DCC family thiol-disulfide oxidoreductase YuxK
MPRPELQPALSTEGRHLLLYDGVCGLCSHLVQFVLARDRGRVFHFAALQSDAGKAALETRGADAGTLTTFYVLTNYRDEEARLLAKGQAALFVAATLGWPWKVARLFAVLPPAWLDRLYELVARHRYRLFGRLDQCLIPNAKDRNRFVDASSGL